MLQLTVKTLDSQNHAFSCEEDITVRGFKDHIADTVSIPADSQRLIYCGRVLQDDKKLTDYGNVDGKVIHLVQRAPPQPESRSSNNEGQRQNNNQGWQSGSHLRLRGHPPPSAMYLSAVSVPTEVEGHGLPAPRLSNTLSNSRLVAARSMLNKASQLMDRLDDPSAPLHPSPTENNSSDPPPQASAPEGETEQESNSNSNENNTTEVNRMAQAASEIAAAFSAAALINIRLPTGNGDGGNITGSINLIDENRPDQSEQAQAQTLESEPESQTSQAHSSETADGSESQRTETDRPEISTADSDNPTASRRSTLHVPRPPQMAVLLERLVSTQDRLRPYIDRYRHLMSSDPVLTPGDTGPEGVAENQRVVDGVSECLHYLSHACHALSDIIVDMGQQPPRNLRCRPIIIQSSAIVQAGIPIQVESHINFNGRPATNNNTTDEGNEATRPSSPSSGSSDQANRSTTANNRAPPQSANGQQNQNQPSLLGLLDLSNIVQMSTEQSPQNTVDLSSSNAVDASENEQSQTNNNNSTSNNVGGSGNMYSMAQPFALIRDALQSVLGDRHAFQVDVSGSAATGNSASNVPFVTIVGQQMDIIAPNSGQSTQARSNIGTHPTTSTQTRSTSRPHVLHPHNPLSVGVGIGNFDPFLPCNSHHVRRASQATANSTSTSQSNQASQFPVSENNSRSQSASRPSATASTSTRQGPGGTSVTFTLVDHSNIARDILDNNGQGLGAMGLPLNLSDFLQVSDGDNVHISFVGSGSNGNEVHMTPNSHLPLAELLRSMNIRLDEFTGRNFLIDLWIFLLRNVTFGSLMRLSVGQSTPLVNLRRPLREFLEHSFPDTPQETLQERVVEQIISLHRPYMQNLVIPEEEIAGRQVDIPATLEALLRRFCFDFLKLLFNNDLDNATFAEEAFTLARKLEDQSSAVLQSLLQGGPTTLETIASRFIGRLTEGIPTFFQQTLLGMLNAPIHAYATRTTQMSQNEINSLLVFKDERPSAPPAEAPIPPTHTPTRAPVTREPELRQEPEVQAQAMPTQQQQQQQPSKSDLQNTEEMEEDDSDESMELEAVETKIDGFVDLAEGQEIPETFPGAENLPPEWVPIIARDSVRQRRQVQIDAMNGGPIPFSDAYLSAMPSKRRKLIEQQKPQLLMSPTPSSTAIAASVERLVREGIVHSRVEEVEGSASAVASTPAVRSAFGHAIRDCIHPSRFRTPDFPNSRRFPNATKVFANEEKDKETSSATSSSSK